MALITKSGHYWRFRCVVCGKYTITKRKHAATCSTKCRKARSRHPGDQWKLFHENLGWLQKGKMIPGKMAEKIRHTSSDR